MNCRQSLSTGVRSRIALLKENTHAEFSPSFILDSLPQFLQNFYVICSIDNLPSGTPFLKQCPFLIPKYCQHPLRAGQFWSGFDWRILAGTSTSPFHSWLFCCWLIIQNPSQVSSPLTSLERNGSFSCSARIFQEVVHKHQLEFSFEVR